MTAGPKRVVDPLRAGDDATDATSGAFKWRLQWTKHGVRLVAAAASVAVLSISQNSFHPDLGGVETVGRRSDWIGLRVARWRDIAGMTQQELADRIGKSRSYVTMIEAGDRPVTKRSLIVALATALGVNVTDLTGQPYEPGSRDEMAMYSAVPALRDALDEDHDDRRSRSMPELQRDGEATMTARLACDYQRVATLLPPLVADIRLVANSTGDGAPEVLEVAVKAMHTAAMSIKSFGFVDLGMRFAERAQRAAQLLGSPEYTAAADYTAAQCALTEGSTRYSLRVATRAADVLGDDGPNNDLHWYGMLHLHAALTSAALGHADDAEAHLTEADRTAERTSGNPWCVEFSSVNVAIWRVGVALENGTPERAPELAARVDRSQIRTVQRRVRLHIDAGRGHFAAGNCDAAVAQLLHADEISSQEVRSRPVVQEIVGQMVRDARRRGGNDALQRLALRVGVDPLDPPQEGV